jgi:hypothetical protein
MHLIHVWVIQEMTPGSCVVVLVPTQSVFPPLWKPTGLKLSGVISRVLFIFIALESAPTDLLLERPERRGVETGDAG